MSDKSREGAATENPTDTRDPINGARFDDDDAVPADIFGPRSDRHGALADAREADFVPADIFQPAAPSQQPPPVPESSAPTVFEPIEDDPPPALTDASSRTPSRTADWFKPFPVAPPLPPLPVPPAPFPAPRVANPAPAFTSAMPRRASSHADTVMMRATSRDDAPPLPSSVDHLLRLAASLDASTLYLSSNAVPSVRVGDLVRNLESTPALAPSDIEGMLISLALILLGPERGSLDATQLDFDVPDLGRVRCNRFRDTRGPGAVFRIVPTEKNANEAVDLSLDIQTLAAERDGLLIVAGPRDSGKESLIGELINVVNRSRPGYVIVVERDLTPLPRVDGPLISHREARGGLDDILAVARAALQENPDVLVLEELHSAPLMNFACDAASSGRLVIAGITAPSATSALARVIELFPPEQVRQVQLSLSRYLRGVIGQVLVPRIGGGRVAARELLLNTRAVSNVLAAGKVEHLGAALAAGRQQGMLPLRDALVDLVQRGVVSAAEAYRRADDPVGFVDELKRLALDLSFVRSID